MANLEQFKQTLVTSRQKGYRKIEKKDEGYSHQHKKVKPFKGTVYKNFPKEKRT